MSAFPLGLQLLLWVYALVAAAALIGNVAVIWRGWARGRHRRRRPVRKIVKTFTSALGGALRRFPQELTSGFWRAVDAI